MSRFLDDLTITPLDDGRHFRLNTPFDYHIGGADSPNTISVPAGFVTDFASTPRLVWVFFPPEGQYDRAACLHDWLYRTRKVSQTDPRLYAPRTWYVTRKQADGVLWEAMQVAGCGAWTRGCIWAGVRIGGWLTWLAYRRQDAREAVR